MKDVGSRPMISPITGPVDSDQDGMPDAWEEQMGLDKTDIGDGKMNTLNKYYSNQEAYLNSLVRIK